MRKIFFVLVLSVLCHSYAVGQGQMDLDRLDEKFTHYLESKLTGWKHERVEPIQGSSALIQFWSASNRKIKIAINPQQSGEKAREKMKEFAKYTREARELEGFGDQAYSWGYAGSNVVFRRGRLVVFVNTYADVDSDPDARTLTQQEKENRERSEMKRLSKEFAKHV